MQGPRAVTGLVCPADKYLQRTHVSKGRADQAEAGDSRADSVLSGDHTDRLVLPHARRAALAFLGGGRCDPVGD